MVPKLHKKGSSFKGAAAYLLHDKGRVTTTERVDWVEARNIAVNDPDMAWRIMAATAMDQDRLKEIAGIKSTGRKSSTPVLHLTLAWHPDEKQSLTPQDMKMAATGAIRTLGAQDHQALVIAHNDEDHPHIHIVINRVNPHDGRMLSSSKEKLNLSRWAESYEKERGKIYCEERVLNNEARDRGEYTRGQKSEHRRLFEEIKAHVKPANDNRDYIREHRNRQKAIDAALAKEGRNQATRHQQEWRSLNGGLYERQQALKDRAVKAARRMVKVIRDAYRVEWRGLRRRHSADREEFERRETQLAGKIQNRIDAVRITLDEVRGGNNRRLGSLFKVLASKGERLAAFERQQRIETQLLHKRQKQTENDAAERIKQRSRIYQTKIRANYLQSRDRLAKSQEQDGVALRKKWCDRHKERRREWHDFARKLEMKDRLKTDFSKAVGGDSDKEATKEQLKARLREARNKDKGRDGR